MNQMATLALRIKNNQFNQGIDKSKNKTNGFAMSANKMKLAVAGAFVAIGLTAIKASTNFIKTYMVQENAVNKLTSAIQKQNGVVATSLPQYKKFATGIQKVTTYGDEATMAMMAYGMNLGITQEKIKEATTASIGLASKLGIDVKTAMMLVARASMGQTQMLTRYGIVLEKGMSDQDKYNYLLKVGADNFKLAKDEALTTAGGLTQLSNAWGDLKEVLGQVIVESSNLFSNGQDLKSMIEDMTKSVKSNATTAIYYIKLIGIHLQTTYSIFKAIIDVTMGNVARMGKFIFDVFAGAIIDTKILFDGVINHIAASYKNLGALIKAVFTGGDISGALVTLIAEFGNEFEKALKKTNIELPKIVGIGDIATEIEKAVNDSVLAQKKLLIDMTTTEAIKKNKDVISTTKKATGTKNTGAKLQSTNRQTKAESSLMQAVERGSIEALKISSTQIRKDEELLKQSRSTAKNTQATVAELKKININNNNISYATVDAFA